jgi:hypothetical protein
MRSTPNPSFLTPAPDLRRVLLLLEDMLESLRTAVGAPTPCLSDPSVCPHCAQDSEGTTWAGHAVCCGASLK